MGWRGRWLSVGLVAVLAVGAAAGRGNVRAAPAPSSCPTDGTPVELVSVEQVEDLLVGVWLRCDGPPLPGSGEPEAGLEVTPDGGFHRLYDADDGATLIRGSGVEQEGTVTVVDLTDMEGPGSYQTDWSNLGGGTASEIVIFTTSPSTMRFGSGTVHVRAEGAMIVDRIVPGDVTGCGDLDDPVTLGPGELEPALVGVWVRCDGPPVMGSEGAEVGIELMADGSAHRLYAEGQGLVRAVGPGHSGTWSIVDDAQLDIDVLGTGTFAYQPTLFDRPQRTMRLIGTTGPTDLRRWDGFAPITGPVPIDVACGGLDDPITPASDAEVIELFVGVWIPCVGDAGPDGQVGIEFAADGRYYRLYRSHDGALVRADGVGQEGEWSLWEDAGVGQYGIGPYAAAPVFYASPMLSMWIELGTSGFPAGAYWRWDGDPPTLGPPRGPVSRCGHLRGVVELDTVQEREARLIGRWTLCDLHSLHGSPLAGEVGIEFGADGRFRLLIQRSDGTVSAGGGTDREGTWGFNGPQTLVLEFEDGQLVHVTPVFLDDPDSVSFRVNRNGTDYVRGGAAVASLPVTLPPTGGTAAGHLGVALLLTAVGVFAMAVSGRRRARM